MSTKDDFPQYVNPSPNVQGRSEDVLNRLGEEGLSRRGGLGTKILLGGTALGSVLILSSTAQETLGNVYHGIKNIGPNVEDEYDNNNTNTNLPENPSEMVVEVSVPAVTPAP